VRGPKGRGMKKDYVALAAITALVCGLPLFVSNIYYLSVLTIIAIHIILALGLNLVMGYAGQISLGHAAFYGIGAYMSLILTSPRHELTAWLGEFSWMPEFAVAAAGAFQHFTAQHMIAAAAFAAAFTGALALIVGIPTLKLKGHYLAMATLGLGIIIQIVFIEEIALTGGPTGLSVPYFRILGRDLDPNTLSYYYAVWLVVIALTLLAIHLVHSRLGRALRAIRADETAAAASGVPVMRMKLMVFSISAMYASVAGTLYAHYITHVNPSPFGFMFSVKLVTMVVVGGMGSIWGALLGVGLLDVLPQFLTVFEDYEMLIFGAVLIIVMMTAPRGLAGLLDAAWRRAAGERK